MKILLPLISNECDAALIAATTALSVSKNERPYFQDTLKKIETTKHSNSVMHTTK